MLELVTYRSRGERANTELQAPYSGMHFQIEDY